MLYRHEFTGQTEEIRCTAPMQWRHFDNFLAAYWEAEGRCGSSGYYVSANPRLSVFFDDVSSIEVTVEDMRRPLARAIYVPAGMPLRTRFTASLAFSHVDIHLDAGWAMQFLSPALTRSRAAQRLAEPHELAELGDLEALARLLVGDIGARARHPIYAQSLAGSLVAALLDIGETEEEPGNARLTAAQMRKVTARFEAGGGRRMSIAQMAEAVALSESWFSQVFKNTTGMTPHQWQLNQRIGQAREMLSETTLSVTEIADRLGFSDQAHLTKSFRQLVGETPAAWRRGHPRS